MKRSSEFHDYVRYDLMGQIPGITSRRMFGGFGIYQDGVFFGLIAEGTLYFKVDDTTKHEYEARGSSPFRYTRKDKKVITLSYWEVPEAVMEDAEELGRWVDRSVAIAKNAKKKHPR